MEIEWELRNCNYEGNINNVRIHPDVDPCMARYKIKIGSNPLESYIFPRN